MKVDPQVYHRCVREERAGEESVLDPVHRHGLAGDARVVDPVTAQPLAGAIMGLGM